MAGAGEDPQRLSNPFLELGQREELGQGCVQLGSEHLQGWRTTISLGSLSQCCPSIGQALCWT